MDLVVQLVGEQRRLNLSDRAFAKRLGMTQAHWSNTKAGKTPIGMKLLAGVAREFPTLANDILKFLQTAA